METKWLTFGALAGLAVAGGYFWYRSGKRPALSVQNKLTDGDEAGDRNTMDAVSVPQVTEFEDELSFFRRELNAFVGLANKHGDGRVLREVDELLDVIDRASRKLQQVRETGVGQLQ